jgi:hypothetical protein
MEKDISVLSGTIDYDKDLWYKSLDPNFFDICLKSRVSGNWMSYQKVISSKFGNEIIKPINNYASVLIPPPRLVGISDNIVKLRYYTFADIYVQWRDEELYNVDRPWIRQYYMTAYDYQVDDTIWSKSYKFYTPWFIDANVLVTYKQVEDEDSAFVIHPTQAAWTAVPSSSEMVYPHFVPFNFRKDGPHMRDDNYGVIEQPHPMFDVTFAADDIIVERVKDFYAKH